jgi:glycine cleavage system H lipoate-binding protein
MKKNVTKVKKKVKGFDAKTLIAPDQPFNYQEVVSITGIEYVRNLHRDGLASLSYENLKEDLPGFYLVENECVWMKAGIINFRLCDTQYDCEECEFDKNMRLAMGEERLSKANAKSLEEVDQVERDYISIMKPCIHFLTGRIGAPIECSKNYECYRCSIHQAQADEQQAKPTPLGEPKYRVASGYKIADPYYYHLGHTWVHIVHGGCVRVGMDEFMAKIFGPAGNFKLPGLGASLKQGRVGWVLERNGYCGPIQSPLTGRILAVNPKVIENPEITHDSPYKDGWLFHLEPWFLKRELNGLYFGEDCLRWMENENQQLLNLLGPKYKKLSATGGRPIDNVFANYPEIGWDRLVHTFLRTGQRK